MTTTTTAAVATATFYVVHGSNDIAWRAEYPAAAVGGKVERILEDGAERLLEYPHNRRPFRWWINAVTVDGMTTVIKTKREWERFTREQPAVVDAKVIYPDHEGSAAVFIRPDLARAILARSMRERDGIRTLAEVDDNYVSNPRWNLALRSQGWDKTGMVAHMKALASMNGIVFSTAWLRDYYRRKMEGRFGKLPGLEWHVCRNNVPDWVWPERIERDGPVRVGWMGSPSHVWDVNLAWPAFRWAHENGAEIHFIGYNPATDPMGGGTLELTEEDAANKSAGSLFAVQQWRKLDIRHIPWRKPETYERFALPLDIGLCPLVVNHHTLGKSDVKWIEYTISGAATVAQHCPVYNRSIIHGETGLLAADRREFIKYTDLLMRDENLRERLVRNAQQYVREYRGLKQLYEEWNAAITG